MSKVTHLPTAEIARLIVEALKSNQCDPRNDVILQGGTLYLSHVTSPNEQTINFLVYSNDNLGTEIPLKIERLYRKSEGFSSVSEFTGVGIELPTPDWSIETAVSEVETTMQQVSVAMQAQKLISHALGNVEGWGKFSS